MAVGLSSRTTVQDAIEHLEDFFGADPSGTMARVARRAIRAALRDLANASNWSYYYYQGRLTINAVYSTGTITGDVTGGANENMVTLASGTWPTWAGSGCLRVANVVYNVDQRISSTILTLKSDLAPATDIAAGTTYKLYQDSYILPEDFVASGDGFYENSWGMMQFVRPDAWLRAHRYSDSGSSQPCLYTFMGDPRVPARLALRLFPQPLTATTLDYVYKRRPKQPQIDEYVTGTATTTSGSASVTGGGGTAWSSGMVGSLMRFYDTALHSPTGWEGGYPAVLERTIRSVTSATALTLTDTADRTLSAVKYRISDPIDVEDGAMAEAFLRCAEYHAGLLRRYEKMPMLKQAYVDALILAKEADSRSWASQSPSSGAWLGRLADMPLGADQP